MVIFASVRSWFLSTLLISIHISGAQAAAPIYAETFARFTSQYGSRPYGITEGTDGNFYGSTREGGPFFNDGTIFKITPGGVISTIGFLNEETIGALATPVFQATDGTFYGATDVGLAAVFTFTTQGNLSVFQSFNATLGYGATDLMRALDGSFYGLTIAGGALGHGTMFHVVPNGDVSVFTPLDLNDAGGFFVLMQATDGTFYGTESYNFEHSGGLIFKVTSTGVESILATFDSSAPENGLNPFGRVAEGLDGDLYGTTSAGGANAGGTFYRVTPDGVLTTLASFPGPISFYGSGDLIRAADGSFYGVESYVQGQPDLIYNITTEGDLATFDGAKQVTATGPFIQASDGYIYGTGFGYASDDPPDGGIIFRFTASRPEVMGFYPPTGQAGASVILTGRYLAGTSSVLFNGTAATFTIQDSTHIKYHGAGRCYDRKDYCH